MKTRRKRKIIGRLRPQSRIVRFEHPAEFFKEPQPDSTHMLICPECGDRRYVDKRFVESLEIIGEMKGTMAVGGMPMAAVFNEIEGRPY